MLIDTHAHVNFNNFKDDADIVIRRALDENTWMINVGSEYKTSKRALDFANRYEKGVYAAVGLHPIHTEEIKAEGEGYSFDTKEEEFNYETYEKLAKFEKVVAIGEIGLDYYHLDQSKNVNSLKSRQKKYFFEQLKLAAELNLPAIIHCRQAHDDTIAIISDFRKEFKSKLPKGVPWGVMHCFSGDENLAWQYYNLGLMISFTGIITFSKQWDELIRKMPAEKFMVETDCPFLTPEPFRGQRNEPIYVKYVAKRIAEIRNITIEKVAEISTKNARNLFNF
jgi:TatD DNase family protein